MNIKTAPLPLLAALAVLGTSACLKSEAKTPAVTVALMVPAPPSRTIVPSPIEAAEPVPPPTNPVSATPPTPKPESPPPATRTAPPAASPPATPPATAANETPVLTAAANPVMKEMEARADKSLTEAEGLLANVKPTQLSPEALGQYNTARSHARMAREALLVYKNFPYALELAIKALTLAKQLSK
jgi:outer membrane biosynthesis protein TonB